MSTQPAEINALRGLAEAERLDEYVEFWPAGALARGLFSCVACGRQVVSAYQLPPCPTCDGALWEELSSSPFGRSEAGFATNLFAYEQWNEDEVDRTAGFAQGAYLALVAGAVLWLFLGLSAYALLEVMHP
jgi:hypothetical protein